MTTTTDYETIQEAINAAVDGDEINLDEETFVEQLTITKGITLSGAGTGKTIIKSPARTALVQSGGDWTTLKNQKLYAVIGIKTGSVAQVTIKNLTVDGDDQGYIAADQTTYTFQGIGIQNSNVIIDDVSITKVRELATDFTQIPDVATLPAGYPTDQPSGSNHNESIGSEGVAGADSYTLVVKNCHISKFHKTGILAWGPTQIVDINNNTIQGYGQTLWSTGNGIQIGSSKFGDNERGGTTGSVTDNDILDIGIVVPSEGNPGYYLNPGLGGSSGILLSSTGDGFTVSGNSITRTFSPSWLIDITSSPGNYANQGIDIYNCPNIKILSNTISGFDAGILEEAAVADSKSTVSDNIFSNNGMDILLNTGNDVIELQEDANARPEIITLKKGLHGTDQIKGFGADDRLFVIDLPSGVIVKNGLLENGDPVIDFSDGTVTAGDGTNVAAGSMQVATTSTLSTLHVNTGTTAGPADLVVKLDGVYYPGNFILDKGYIKYNCLGEWLGATSTDWDVATNWGCGTVPISTTNVFVGSFAVRMPVVNITDATCNNLAIYSGASLTISAGKTLDINGDAENEGTFTASGKTVFSGESQKIPSGIYENLQIAGTGTMTLDGEVSVSGELTLTTGYVELDENDILIEDGGSITGGSSSSFIVTNSTGKLKQGGLGTGGITGPIVFPIGTTALSYTPVTITNTGTQDVYGVRVITGVNSEYDDSEIPSGAAQTTNNVNKTWFLSEGTEGGSQVTLDFHWNSSDEQSGFVRTACFASHYLDNKWTAGATASAQGSNPYYISLTGITQFSPFGVGSEGSVLPLTLLSFNASASEEQVSLTWETVNEVNFAGFDIEAASNAVNFKKIGYKEAQKNNLVTRATYQFSTDHLTSSGIYYYRLKMIDTDGKFAYSKMQSVRYNTKVTDYQLFPNPVTGDQLSLRSAQKKTGTVQIKIVDITGRQLHQSTVNNSLPDGYFSIPVKNLVKGTNYLLQVTELETGRRQTMNFIRE
ncbi:right-handed parallel beta-helix repeat-containing protein [Dyadobacter helix]|uniref:right-handed parallel beta-helix repeat-containing protein n=1 Tax=Dyadobacter helix TaxID=2822344 RepID=UPI001BFC5A29|nr:hypothetical protein [Dyadobacter sp. CECT 9275]